MADKVPVFGKSLYDYINDENMTQNENGVKIPGDCTSAFERAFADISEKKNALLTIPAGDFAVYKPLCLPSGLFLDVHPHAEIEFCGFETDENAENIRIRGGVWRLQGDAADACAFEFSEARGITLENAKIYSGRGAAIGFCGGNDIRVENCSFYGIPGTSDTASAGILLGGTSDEASLEGIYAHGCDRLIEITPGSCLKRFSAKAVTSDDCLYFLYGDHADIQNAVLHELSGCAHADAVYLADCTIEKLEMRGLDLYNGFFMFARNKIGNVRLERFRRRYDLDKNAATKATLYISGQTCAIAADIVSLDSILRTGKLCPNIKLAAARRSSPLIQPDTPFVYTFHAALSETDTYIMPSGSFDDFTMTKAAKDN